LSSTAKGAVIGAGVGATGAIISKKKQGAIIGGVAGAGVELEPVPLLMEVKIKRNFDLRVFKFQLEFKHSFILNQLRFQ
jgi:uncharacterized spore protein YtfJ